MESTEENITLNSIHVGKIPSFLSIETRMATYDDIPWLMEQLKQFSTFIDSSFELYEDDEFAEGFMANFIDNHFLSIAHKGDKRLGFIGGVVGHHPLNPNISTLAELFWWVDPNSRGGRAAILLLKDFVSWGKANVQLITVSLLSISPVRDATLLKRGFKLQEKTYILEV